MKPKDASRKFDFSPSGVHSKHPFFHELHCIGSLHSVLKHFMEMTGWTLTYHCADSVPEFLRNEAEISSSVQLGNSLLARQELTPAILAEIDRDEDCWLPVDIHSEFQDLVSYEASEFQENDSNKDKNPELLQFLKKPIGFLHLSRPSKPESSVNPTELPFQCFHFQKNQGSKTDAIFFPQKEVSFEEARFGAASIRDFISEMQILRVHLWLLEQNALANAPILEKSASYQNELFAARFRQLLEFMAKSYGLAAIGIYLFDAKHQQFRLRAHVGLSLDSYTQPGRKLANAQADLRAFDLEHLIIHDASIAPDQQFQMPEAFESGVCMPLRTDRSKLGSVWFYSNQKYFPEKTIQQCQILAELLALSIEREAFLRRHGRSIEYRSELKKASDIQTIQNPIQVSGRKKFDLKGRICAAPSVSNPYKSNRKVIHLLNEEKVSGDFYDWFLLPSGQTLVALGSVGIRGLAGAILAASVRSALRSHARYQNSASEILHQVHETLWHQLAANTQISLFCGILNQEGSYLALHFAHTGSLRALKVNGNTFSQVGLNSTETVGFLGGTPDFHCYVDSLYMNPGESFAVFNDGLETNPENQPSNVRPVWNKILTSPPAQAKTSPQSTSKPDFKTTVENVATFQEPISAELESLLFEPCEYTKSKSAVNSQKLEMMKQIVDIELGQSFCEKQYPTASLLALQAKNYFEKHVTKTRSDQSILVIQHLARRKTQN